MSARGDLLAAGGARHGLLHALQGLRAIVVRELLQFVQQTGRLVSALVRPLLWLAVFGRQLENFAGTMNFVIFPMCFPSTALYPLRRARHGMG